MRVLLVFNYYQQPGGEEQAFSAESALLESKGHFVLRYSVRNDAIGNMNRAALAAKVIWNGAAGREIRTLVREHSVDIVHCHNTFPLISPSAYYAAQRAGARVVQTLHNFRLVCPAALLSREGRLCEECLGRSVAWRGIRHACYRGSRAQSAAVTAMLATHRALGTWVHRVDRYVALSEFAKQKFVEGGLPEKKISVKPNFIDPDPGPGEARGSHALFVGRLSAEKGISTLLSAWQQIGVETPLRIVGDGPLAGDVTLAADRPQSGIEYLGRRSRAETLALMKQAAFLVFPSTWYEGFPMTIAEAFASGLPVLSSALGTMQTLVTPGRTGLHFPPGDADGLAACVRWIAQRPEKARSFGQNARREYLANYSADSNYRKLMSIYQEALGSPLPAGSAIKGQTAAVNAR